MTWVTWRRFRTRVVLLALFMLMLTFFMIMTLHGYHDAVAKCGTQAGMSFPETACARMVHRAESHANYVSMGIGLLPFLVGLMLGAPLVASEIENRTNRLAWSQGITRTRWLLSGWLTIAVPVVIAMSLFGLIVQWWASHVVTSSAFGAGLIQNTAFDISGVAPIAFSVFALSCGTCFGVASRRFLSPYLGTFVALFAVAEFMYVKIFPTLAPRMAVAATSYGTNTDLPSSLGPSPRYVGYGFRPSPGIPAPTNTSSTNWIVQHCAATTNAGQTLPGNSSYMKCLNINHVQAINFYQPESHYWILQWREAGIYLVLAAALLGLSVWMVGRWRA
jgi:hypothetical protein